MADRTAEQGKTEGIDGSVRKDDESATTAAVQVVLPRVTIVYCTQCRWMLRAAYFAQELLSTFGTTIGEVALIPATGGLFRVELSYDPHASANEESGTAEKVQTRKVLLWDRKSEGGFPETKVLKQRVRDHLEPNRDLGHSDVGGKKKRQDADGQVALTSASTSTLVSRPASTLATEATETESTVSTVSLQAEKETTPSVVKPGEETVALAGKEKEVCEDCQ